MKKLIFLLLAVVMFFSLYNCVNGGKSNLKIVGKWNITDLDIEPQYGFVTARNDTVNQIAEAFPEIDTMVEFTRKKYEDGYKMISSSNIASYSLMSNRRISVGDAVGTYRLSGNTLIIEFKDIATITLKK